MTDHKRIQQALHLGQKPERIHRYYDQWSDTYDRDVLSENYLGPRHIATLARELFDGTHGQDSSRPSIADARVLDAGCGTGLAGVALHAAGFQHLVGADLSPNMTDKARETGVYRSLHAPVDLSAPLDTQLTSEHLVNEVKYDVVVCVGVFTLGHVAPSALCHLLQVTRPGGWVLVSAREEYCDKHNFEPFCQELDDAGHADIVYAQWDNYVSDDRALYIALARSNSDMAS